MSLPALIASIASALAPSAHNAQAAQPEPSHAQAQPPQKPMVVSRSQDRPTRTGPSANFTGTVYVSPLFAPQEGSRVSGGHVAFTSGARSNWHTHPVGQTLIVTEGSGW
ncbi:hypothetical protein LTR94_024571, partial [Friedmanniomyces endolithicus]